VNSSWRIYTYLDECWGEGGIEGKGVEREWLGERVNEEMHIL